MAMPWSIPPARTARARWPRAGPPSAIPRGHPGLASRRAPLPGALAPGNIERQPHPGVLRPDAAVTLRVRVVRADARRIARVVRTNAAAAAEDHRCGLRSAAAASLRPEDPGAAARCHADLQSSPGYTRAAADAQAALRL